MADRFLIAAHVGPLGGHFWIVHVLAFDLAPALNPFTRLEAPILPLAGAARSDATTVPR
jgi:hypothetical protein